MPPSDEDLLASAKQLHDQAEYLLNDEIAYAESLRESRKTATTLVIVVFGVGLFRLDLYRHVYQVLVVPPVAAMAIRAMFLAALILLLCGAYRIYTERGVWKEFWPEDPENDDSKPSGGGALRILYLRQEVLAEYWENSPLNVMRMRTDGLRAAYIRLKKANRRVRKRLQTGIVLVFFGLGIILGAFGLYTFTVDWTANVPEPQGANDEAASYEGGRFPLSPAR